jgi:hypothetical protein
MIINLIDFINNYSDFKNGINILTDLCTHGCGIVINLNLLMT